MTTHIPHLDVGSGRYLGGGLTLFPVWTDTPSLHGLEWRGDQLAVSELAAGANVPQLTVANGATRATVIIEGDLLVGGLQNRMAASSRIVGAGRREDIDVVCVEHGRWNGQSEQRWAGMRGATSVRHGNIAGRDELGHDRGAQGEVWRRVARYNEHVVRSETSSMVDHLAATAGAPVRRMPGQRGVIVGIGGRVIGAEIFGSSRGLAARWDGLIRAAQLDARLAPSVPTPGQAARDFVRAMGRMSLRDGGEAGLARRVRSQNGSLRLSGIGHTAVGIADDEILALEKLFHLAAFDDAHPLLENA